MDLAVSAVRRGGQRRTGICHPSNPSQTLRQPKTPCCTCTGQHLAGARLGVAGRYYSPTLGPEATPARTAAPCTYSTWRSSSMLLQQPPLQPKRASRVTEVVLMSRCSSCTHFFLCAPFVSPGRQLSPTLGGKLHLARCLLQCHPVKEGQEGCWVGGVVASLGRHLLRRRRAGVGTVERSVLPASASSCGAPFLQGQL